METPVDTRSENLGLKNPESNLTRGNDEATVIESYNEDEHSIELIFSTGAPVYRETEYGTPVYEVLNMSEESIDLSDLNNGAPFSVDHESGEEDKKSENVIGGVKKAWFDGESCRSIVNLSKNEEKKGKVSDVIRGIVRGVSCEYSVSADPNDIEILGTKDGIPVVQFNKWRPYMLNSTPIGADRRSMTRSSPNGSSPIPVEKFKLDLKIIPSKTSSLELSAEKIREDEVNRINQIKSLSMDHSCLGHNFYTQCLKRNMNVEESKTLALEKIKNHVKESTKTKDLEEKFVRSENASSNRKTHFELGDDKIDHLKRNAKVAMLNRFNPQDFELDSYSKPYENYSAFDIACLLNGHQSSFGIDKEVVARRAMTTSDFKNLLGDISHTIAMKEFKLRSKDAFYLDFCEIVHKDNFAVSQEGKYVSEGPLQRKTEGGEFKTYKIKKSVGEPWSLGTFGKTLQLTRETLIGAQESELFKAIKNQGQRLAKLELSLIMDFFNRNPYMVDGHRIFSKEHNNLLDPAEFNQDNIYTALDMMAAQVDENGDEIGIDPEYLLYGRQVGQQVDAYHFKPVFPAESSQANIYNNRKHILLPKLKNKGSWIFVSGKSQDVANFELGYLHGKRQLKQNVYYENATMSIDFQFYADIGARPLSYKGFFMGIAPERKPKK